MLSMTTNNEAEKDRPLIQVSPKKRTVFFIILYLLFAFDLIARVGVNALFPLIQADLQLTDTQVGLMGSVVLAAMGIFVLPVSFLGEKFSPKKAITFCVGVWTAGTVCTGMAANFQSMIMARFLTGSGNASYAPLSNALITSMYPRSKWGKMVGIYNTAMAIGMAVGALVFANVATTIGWRNTFFIISAISVCLGLASLTLPDTKKILKQKAAKDGAAQNKVNTKDAFKMIVKSKSLIGVCLCAATASMVVQGLNGWYTIYFVREMDFSIAKAATMISVLAVVAALGYPTGGAVMDKWYQYDKRARVFLPIICLVIGAVSFVIAFKIQSIVLIALGVFCTSTANTCYHVATQELVASWFKSVSYGVYVVFVQLLGSMGPILIGTFSERMGLSNAMIVMQGFLVVAIVLFALISRIYVQDFNRARAVENEGLQNV